MFICKGRIGKEGHLSLLGILNARKTVQHLFRIRIGRPVEQIHNFGYGNLHGAKLRMTRPTLGLRLSIGLHGQHGRFEGLCRHANRINRLALTIEEDHVDLSVAVFLVIQHERPEGLRSRGLDR